MPDRRTLTLAVAVALLAAACGSGAGGGAGAPASSPAPTTAAPAADPAAAKEAAAREDVLAAMRRTLAKGSAEVYTRSYANADGPGLTTLESSGSYDFRARRARFDIEAKVSGRGVVRMSELLVDGTAYLYTPALDTVTGSRWLSAPAGTLGRLGGLDLRWLDQFESADPAYVLAFLAGAKDVMEAGTERRYGARTTHYTMVTDVELAARRAPQLRKRFAGLRRHLEFANVPTEVWVDRYGLVRAVDLRFDLRYGADAPVSSITVDLAAYGTSVAVAAPEPGLTVALSDLR